MQIKDHKEGFPQRIEYRLLNPSKSSIGALSKKFECENNQEKVEDNRVNVVLGGSA